MEIQVALDRLPLDRAAGIAQSIAPWVDWIEVGTSLVKQYGEVTALVKQFGQDAVRRIGAAAGTTPVLADLKTVDDVRFEFGVAFDAGARSVTVLGLAPDVTVDLAVEVAREHDREVVVDLMGLESGRIEALAGRLPDHREASRRVVLAPHVGKDAQAGGAKVVDLLGDWARGRWLAVAGGLTAEDLPALRTEPRLRVIVGSAVTRAEDPLTAVHDLRRAAGRSDS